VRKLVEQYIPAEITDYRERAWAQYLNTLALAGTPFWLAFSLWYAFGLNYTPGALLLGGVGLCCLLVLPILRRTKSVLIGANALCACIFIGISGLAVMRGGFPFVVLLWSSVIPVAVARQNIFRRLAFVWLALCLVQYVFFYALYATGNAATGIVVFSESQLMFEQFMVLVAFLLLLLTISFSTVRVTDEFASERDEYLAALVHSQRVEALGSLAGGLAHDFNNVLTAVQFSADVISYELPDDHQSQREVVHLREAIDRSRALTRQLLNLGRRRTHDPEPVSINDEITGVEPMLRRVVDTSVKLELSLAERLPRVRIDASRLEQVLINLAVNASNALEQGGRITIRTFKSGSSVVIEVADNGCGIPHDVAAKMFDAFFTTKEEGKGTGLGLWISRTIIRDAGGDLVADSEPGRGTTFQIKLPPHVQRKTMASGSRSIKSIPAREAGCILIVNDSDANLRAAELMLTRRGYDVICADSCTRAMELVDSGDLQIDLVIADVVLPEMDGAELAAKVRAQRPDLKVLLMSNQVESAQRRADFIPTTFDDDELVTFVQASLDERN